MTRDVAAVLAIVDELVRAWNSGERETFPGLFAERAVYRTGAGAVLAGRSEIARVVGGPRICLTEDTKIDLDKVRAVVRLSWREVGGDRSGVSILLLARTTEESWEIRSCETVLD